VTGARGWNALPSPLRDALASGATLVTPTIGSRAGSLRSTTAAQRTGRARGVGRADVLPVERLARAVVARRGGIRRGAACELHHARASRISLEAHRRGRPVFALLDEEGLATLASDAWTLVHGWGAGGASWRGWSGATTTSRHSFAGPINSPPD
jgi:hypothetical protein